MAKAKSESTVIGMVKKLKGFLPRKKGKKAAPEPATLAGRKPRKRRPAPIPGGSVDPAHAPGHRKVELPH